MDAFMQTRCQLPPKAVAPEVSGCVRHGIRIKILIYLQPDAEGFPRKRQHKTKCLIISRTMVCYIWYRSNAACL